MNRFPLLSKTLMIGLLTLLLLIPLGMIESKISERQFLQTSVQREIARSSSGAQTVSGPFLVVSYKLRTRQTYKDEKGVERINLGEAGPFQAVFAPHVLNIGASADVETRSRGIYQARLFNLKSTIRGDFRLPRGYGIDQPVEDILPHAAYLVLNMSDARGIRNAPRLKLNGSGYEFAPGSVTPLAGAGIHVPLDAPEPGQAHAYDFEFPFDLQGMSTLAVSPAGDTTEMTLASAWPHPSFGGSFLPRSRTVNRQGFSAQWLVSNLARNNAVKPGAQQAAAAEAFSVDFIDPVNVYLMSERAVKYGILFVVLVFTAFFLFEVLKSLRIHPMQYLLVGSALAMFFLLIISLSEHIAFVAAYALSGIACVTLIGIYLSGVLKNLRLGLGFSAGIAALYAVLYGVLQSEDNALLTGSLVLFGALAALMILTRRMDWYRLNRPETDTLA